MIRESILCVGLFFSIGLLSQIAFAQTDRPNFLVILGDDISSSSLGCYGSENPNTSPNIDQLAKEGIRFTNMFVSEAICGPARAELYTGLQPHRNGCVVNNHATKEGTLSVVQHLKKLGYRVGLTGKTHIKPRSVYPFEKVKGFPTNCNAREISDEDWEDVEAFITRDLDQPFCLFICSIHAHSPWDAGDTSRWKLDDLNLPPSLYDTETTRRLYREYLGEVRLFDEQVGKARALLKQKNIDANTALIVLDENGAGMPCGKWTTFDWGVRSACVVKWPGLESAAFTTDALVQYCDILPTMIEAAGGDVPDGLDGKSLLPLLKQETKAHRQKAFFNYNNGSVGPQFSSRAVTDGRFKLMWNLTPDNLLALRTVNGFDFGYVDKMEDRHVRAMYRSWLEKAATNQDAAAAVGRFRKQPEFQLYDLSLDPWERKNLASDPDYVTQLGELKDSIKSWMQQTGDSGFYQQAEKNRK